MVSLCFVTLCILSDDVLRPSDMDKLMAVKPSSETQYVPDIFFVEKDKYKNEIKQSAKPTFPVEYLVVDLQPGAPVRHWRSWLNSPVLLSFKLTILFLLIVQVDSPNPTFSVKGKPFPIEHRQGLGQFQTLAAILDRVEDGSLSFLEAVRNHGKRLRQCAKDCESCSLSFSYLLQISDFHLLFFLYTDEVLKFLRVSCVKCGHISNHPSSATNLSLHPLVAGAAGPLPSCAQQGQRGSYSVESAAQLGHGHLVGEGVAR